MNILNSTMKIVSLLIIISLPIFSCSQYKKQWKIIDAQLVTEFEIGKDSKAFLSHPEFLVVDSNSNIIIADLGRSELLVFDNTGKFLHPIGERGPGPNQFRDITGMTINDKDEIIVLDRGSQTLKKFSVEGEHIKSYKLPSPITTKVEFEFWQNYQFLFFVRPNLSFNQNYLMHIYSMDFNHLIINSIPVQNLDNITREMIPLFMGDTGSHLILGQRILFAPYLYNGKIYQYNLSGNLSSIKFSKEFSGYTYKNPISIVSKNKKESGYVDGKLSGPETTLNILIHNQSKGLFRLSDGKIVHFTYIENEKSSNRIFGIEFYDKNLQSLGYSPIYYKPYLAKPDANNLIEWEVVWKDRGDQFYIIDKKNIPKIRVVSLQYDTTAI